MSAQRNTKDFITPESKPFFGSSVVKAYKAQGRSNSSAEWIPLAGQNVVYQENSHEVIAFFPSEQVIAKSRVLEEFKNPTIHSVATEQWEGHVSHIEGDDFVAELNHVGNKAPIQAEFSIYDVEEGDRSLVKVGAPFRWVIGRETKVHGQIQNGDFLIFKRTPLWRGFDITKPSAVADEYSAAYK